MSRQESSSGVGSKGGTPPLKKSPVEPLRQLEDQKLGEVEEL
jgi:hypothetical protein